MNPKPETRNPEPPLALHLAGLDRERRMAYAQHLEFYSGRQWAGRARLGERRLTFNYARVLIDKVAAYVMAESGVQLDPPSAGSGRGVGTTRAARERARRAEEVLLDIYADNGLGLLDLDNEIDTSVLGDGAYKVTWDPQAKRVRITAPDVQGLYAWWQADDPARLWRVATRYPLEAEEAARLYNLPAGKRVWVTEVWTEQRFELWADQTRLRSGANPYGAIPFVIYPNVRRPKSFWGESDILAIRETVREINRELSALSQIMELSGNPVAVLENVDKAQEIAVQPGAVWELPERARAYLLDLLAGRGVALHIDYVNLLYRALHDLGEAPRTAFGDNQRNLSGVALEVELQPLLQRVHRKRLVRAEAFARRARLALRIYDLVHGTAHAEAGLVRILWGSVVPRDRSRLIEQETALVRGGLASYTGAMTRLGVANPEAELALWEAEEGRAVRARGEARVKGEG